MQPLLPPLLSPKKIHSDSVDFIVNAVVANPNATLACCQFDIDYFSVALFDKLGLILPEHLQRAAAKRQAEYLASRWLIATLLAQHGVPHWQLFNRDDRSPIWPSGVAGSLSHHKNKVFVVLDTAPTLVGNDIELTIAEHNAAELAAMVMDSNEAAILTAAGLPLNIATTLLFSAKETAYKAVYPVVQKIFDFSEVKLLSLTNATVTVRLSSTARPFSLVGDQLTINYWQTDREVLTWSASPCL